MNQNNVIIDRWSNDDSQRLYEQGWPREPEVKRQYEEGQQCGGCSFFAKFNYDWGLCCHAGSRHHLETIFEHFTCPKIVNEGWEAHSFREHPESDQDADMDAIYEILDRRHSTGQSDLAERHNEHQP